MSVCEHKCEHVHVCVSVHPTILALRRFMPWAADKCLGQDKMVLVMWWEELRVAEAETRGPDSCLKSQKGP